MLQNLPGMTSRTDLLPTRDVIDVLFSRGKLDETKDFQGAEDRAGTHIAGDEAQQTPELQAAREHVYETQLDAGMIITGTPKTVLPKIRNVLETLRPGQIFFWDGDGSMSHEDAMRSLRLMGEEVLPAVKQMGEELGLSDAFQVDPATDLPGVEAAPAAAD